ncbi:MAG: glycosyltransferase family protein [Dysgonamonadaceae bacterium]|jgi:GT2 family glycosyltransferase|nr:glycosyltransferase family protein [Dysgonamonadaceae bacterium]
MISIIVCSKHPDLSEALKTNIRDTIGVPYELIVIDNSTSRYSIFEAYNEGVKRAKHPYLCFMHEDVWYHSANWGESVVRHLSDPHTGLIGLAGSQHLLAVPSSWFHAQPRSMNMMQTYVSPSGEKQTRRRTVPKDTQVLGIDGFWFCARKAIFDEVSFDNYTFPGFHFYDVDLAMQIHAQGYAIYVVSDILVEHKSLGFQNSQWINSVYRFYDKWKDQLPATLSPGFQVPRLSNIKAFKDLLYTHHLNKYPIPKKTWKIGWERLKGNLLTACGVYLYSRIKYRNKPLR